MRSSMPTFAGWHPLGRFPADDRDGVGSWLLHHGGAAMLLEIPPGLRVGTVRTGLRATGCQLRFATASHLHGDHFDADAWAELQNAFPAATFMRPVRQAQDEEPFDLGGERGWFVGAPKHSWHDVVAVFRGVAMTGDVELNTADSCNREVPRDVRLASMAHLAGFERRTGHHVHTTVSAHVNDIRTDVDWAGLFAV